MLSVRERLSRSSDLIVFDFTCKTTFNKWTLLYYLYIKSQKKGITVAWRFENALS